MLRYKTENRPGLVALYDIRPGNGAGIFLQPRSPHGAYKRCKAPDKLSPSPNINTQLFTGRMPFLSPNQPCQITEGKWIHAVKVLSKCNLCNFRYEN